MHLMLCVYILENRVMEKIRCYSELIQLKTFEERFEYLKLTGEVGIATFGFDRYLNQVFYHSPEWKRVRDFVLVRDNGCDLGIQDRPIPLVRDKNGRAISRILIHHMNPITEADITMRNPDILNPEFLICVGLLTHTALHYSNADLLPQDYVERTPFDTCPWRKPVKGG